MVWLIGRSVADARSVDALDLADASDRLLGEASLNGAGDKVPGPFQLLFDREPDPHMLPIRPLTGVGANVPICCGDLRTPRFEGARGLAT